MKVALVHDYLHTYGGGERVLELFHEIYPQAPIYTLIYKPDNLPDYFRKYDIRTTGYNKLPFRTKLFKYYVPFIPAYMESIDLSSYDVVISISAGFAKGILTPVSTCHISYTLTVPRFLWGYETSTQSKHRKNILLPAVNNYLRVWDKAAAERVDFFIANSETVKKRVAKSYGRNAKVIYSPVDEEKFSLSSVKREDFYLVVSRMEKYKHLDLAIKACIKEKKKLRIIGDGPEREYLEKIAKGKVDFLGKVSDEIALRFYKSAKAVIFPGADDLGLVPIEAQMCGTPVIAYKQDGALETVAEDVTGVFFNELSVDSLADAIRKFESASFDINKIRTQALRFSKSKIKNELKLFISEAHKEYKKAYPVD